MGKGSPWTREDIDLLVDNYYRPGHELTELLGRSLSSIVNMRHKIAHHKVESNFQKTPAPKVEVRRRERPVQKWTKEDLEFIYDTLDKSLKEIAAAMGRSESAVTNARIRVKREHGIEIKQIAKHAAPPEQDLWKLPPGTYTKSVGTVLLEHPEVFECWLHAHGYTSFKIDYEDSFGWTHLTCVKES